MNVSIVFDIFRRDGRKLAKELALPLACAPSLKDSQIASRSKQINVFSFCDSHLHVNEISAIVGPRIAALASVLVKDYEEGE